jgi:hypothetical protein
MVMTTSKAGKKRRHPRPPLPAPQPHGCIGSAYREFPGTTQYSRINPAFSHRMSALIAMLRLSRFRKSLCLDTSA